MSYILDALRKSDQQRQRRTAPTLLASHAPVEVPKHRVSMSHVLVAAVLIAAGVAIGSLRPWQTEQPAATMKPAATQSLEASPHSSSAPVAVPPQVTQESERNLPAPKPAPIAQSAMALVGEAEERQVSKVRKVEARARTPRASSEASKAPPSEMEKPVPEKRDGAGEVAQEQKAIAMSELPMSIRQELPNISFSVHAYSRVPKDRLVSIDDRVLREGEYVAPGLLLEQITLDGVIMSYKGYRFQRGAR